MAEFRRIRYRRDPAVELRTRALRLVVVTGRGPRIAHLSQPGGANLLLWAPGKYRRNQWDLLGGHRLWLTRPGADESEETYFPDLRRCLVEIKRGALTVTTPRDPATRLVRGLTIRVLAADRLEVEHFVRNESDMLWSGGLWGLTCTVPNRTTTYTIPLADGSAWDTAGMTFFKKWGGSHTGAYNDPQFTLTADGVVLRAQGTENKRAFRAAPGIIAMHDPDRRVLFAKRSLFLPGADYPLASNLAVYTGPGSFMVEMETMSPHATLRPGEGLTHAECWVLRAAPKRVPGARRLAGLFA